MRASLGHIPVPLWVAPMVLLTTGTVVHRVTPGGPGSGTSGAVCYPPSGGRMDLCWNSTDPNGIPENPRWRSQIEHPEVPIDAGDWCGRFLDNPPPCTKWATDRDVVPLGSPLGIFHYVIERTWHPKPRVHGHVNWGPATFVGHASFEDHQASTVNVLLDDDYDVGLLVDGNAGLTVGNHGSLGLEFKASETVDHFTSPPTYWSELKETVDREQPFWGLKFTYPRAHTLLRDRSAIVVGLLGIDTEHAFATELHPVWAAAFDVSSPAAPGTRWAFFARNWGNEGNLSDRWHLLPLHAISLLFSNASIGSNANVLSIDCYDRLGKPVVGTSTRTDKGIVLSVPVGDMPSIVFGEIRFAR